MTMSLGAETRRCWSIAKKFEEKSVLSNDRLLHEHRNRYRAIAYITYGLKVYYRRIAYETRTDFGEYTVVDSGKELSYAGLPAYVAWRLGCPSKLIFDQLNLVSALSETKCLCQLFRFYIILKESFDVSIEPK